MPKLSDAQIQDFLKHQPSWNLKSGKLVREWTFKDFVEAMAFVNRVAGLAEAEGHHPDIDIRYNQVSLALVSHDAGGITDRDANMAQHIDAHFDANA
jgi:4a-hydroxytetrahydrobiopterin dehydratase